MDSDEFKRQLSGLNNENEVNDFCRKVVLHGIPSIFRDKEHNYYEFRKKIATQFNVSFHEVYITGSAKLGFSPFKNKEFDLESDIDVAIISDKLFEEIMWKIYKFQQGYRESRKVLNFSELKNYHDFLEYTALGWIRPDKLPISFQMKELKDEWFEFFNSLSYGRSEVGNHKVSAGVFKTYQHYESYIVSGFDKLRRKYKIQGYHS
ncbi:hypothetical protein OHV61_16280 [Acinetobacter baumannii]|nr:hypothetical protein [Acinetobacter baumannii]